MSEIDSVTLDGLSSRLSVLEHQYGGIIKNLLVIELIKRRLNIIEEKIDKMKGMQGPQGVTGIQGIQGMQGPQGVTGCQGINTTPKY